MKKHLKGFVLGVIITTLLMSTAFGQTVTKAIEVVYNSVNLTVNGKKVEADNILYEGTTYVPLRAIAEILDKEVGWDQATKTASINDKGSTPIIEPKKINQDPIEVSENEFGKISILKRDEAVNITKNSGPFRVTIEKMQISSVEPAKEYKYMFNNKEKATVVTLYMSVENNSEGTNSIYPDQGIITTNTKEQVDADLMLSEDVGGDYIGEVVKKGNIYFILDSEAELIQTLKYTISRPINSNWDSLGEDLVFDLKFK